MPDKLSFSFPPLTNSTCFDPPDQAPRAPDALDLTTFSQWLGLQSTATIVNLLDVTANELYRRQDWPGIAGRLKDVVRELDIAVSEKEMLIVKIHNDGTGTKVLGNYNVSVCVNQDEIWHGRVEGHVRTLGWSELVRRVVKAYRGRVEP